MVDIIKFDNLLLSEQVTQAAFAEKCNYVLRKVCFTIPYADYLNRPE